MDPCSIYSRLVLERFLAGTLTEPEALAIEEHIKTCPPCHDAIRGLVGLGAAPQPETTRDLALDPSPSVLERLLEACPPPEGPPPLRPTIPRYDVRDFLGKGGMAAVWLAFQVQDRREVALKVLHPVERLSGGEEGRLLNEALAVAKLNHANIIRIYDVGLYEGRPYLSLELCPGGSLAARLEKVGGSLEPREAAAIIKTIARAVQHAHERGIVHRDLKPANILLVDGEDTPLEQCDLKVTDFGLAKRVDVAGPTATGTILGTLAYMSPEQIRGEKGVGPATDVHALGVMLYQLLAGRLPYEGPNAEQTMLLITQKDPVPLQQARPEVSRELETICMKCLEKDPKRRYGSAKALAKDLKRWLDGKAIVARPPSTWRRAGRWVWGRAAIITVAALVLVIVVGSLGGWVWGHYSHQRERAAFENVRASLKQSLAAIDVARFTPGADEGHDSAELRKELAEKVPLYEAMIRQDPTDEELRWELATIYRRLAWLEALSGDKDKAAALAQKARTLLAELATAHPDSTPYESDLADVHSDLGTIDALRRQWDEAREAYQEAIRRRERLAAKNVGGEDQAGQLAFDWLALGELHHVRRNRAGADAAFARAEEVQRRRAGIDPGQPGQATTNVAYFFERARALLEVGRDQEADEAFRDAVASLDELCPPGAAEVPLGIGAAVPGAAARAIPPEHPVRTLRDLIRLALAEETFQKAIEFQARRAKDHPGEPAYRERLGRSCFYLMAITFRNKGAAGAEKALAAARQGTDVYDELLRANPVNGDYSLREAQLCHVTAAALLLAGRKDEAETWCAKALAILDAAKLGDGQQAPARAIRRDTLLVRGTLMGVRQRYPEALRDFSRAFAIDPRVQQGSQGEYYAVIVMEARRQMVVERLRKGRYPEAIADAEMLAGIPGIAGEALYDGACVFGVAAAAEKDPALREKYAARSVGLLRLAFAAGFGKDPHQAATGIFGDPIEHMEGDADLAAVRGRDDYAKLLADLTRKP